MRPSRELIAVAGAVAIALLVLRGSRAEACACPQVSGPSEGVAVADVAVQARISSEREVFGRRFLVLDVSRVFKGDAFSTELLQVHGDGNNCDPALSVGGEYIVFAFEGAWPALASTVCLPNSPAGTVDATLLRALGAPYPPRRLWGRLFGAALVVIFPLGALWRLQRRRQARA